MAGAIDPSGHVAQLRNFIDAVRGEGTLLVDEAEGRKALALASTGSYTPHSAASSMERIASRWNREITPQPATAKCTFKSKGSTFLSGHGPPVQTGRSVSA